jgi:DegV family protein with EDD domain
MSKLIFFVDATCDIPLSYIKEHNIQVIGLRYNIGDVDSVFSVANDAAIKNFYDQMRKGKTPKTSLVTYQDAEAAFEPFFRDGCDIVHLGLSSGLALTYKNECDAGTDLAKKYGRRFYAPDTHLVSMALYPVLKKIIELNDCAAKSQGDAFEKITAELPAYYSKVKEYFTVESLAYLHRGGRLSAGAAIVGGILNVKPILTADKEGKLENIGKVIGRQKALRVLANYVKTADKDGTVVAIVHADCLAEAKILEKMVKEINPKAQIEIGSMGFIIGTHTGPGTIGLCFVDK